MVSVCRVVDICSQPYRLLFSGTEVVGQKVSFIRWGLSFMRTTFIFLYLSKNWEILKNIKKVKSCLLSRQGIFMQIKVVSVIVFFDSASEDRNKIYQQRFLWSEFHLSNEHIYVGFSTIFFFLTSWLLCLRINSTLCCIASSRSNIWPKFRRDHGKNFLWAPVYESVDDKKLS